MKILKLAALALSVGCIGAQAAPVSYDFTATVTGDDFNACGSQIVGTFTYDTQPTGVIYEDSWLRHYRDETPTTTIEIHCDFGSVVVLDSSVTRLTPIIDMGGMLQLDTNQFDGVQLQSLAGYNVERASISFSEINNTTLDLPEQLPSLAQMQNKSIHIDLNNGSGQYAGVYAEITSLTLGSAGGVETGLPEAQLDISIQSAMAVVPVGAGVPIDYRLISQPDFMGPASVEHWATVVRPDGVELPLDLANNEPMEQGWAINRNVTFRTEPYWPLGEYTVKVKALQTNHTPTGDEARFGEAELSITVE